MSRPFIGVRWWLGIAFAVVAATSTAIVVAQFSDRSEAAFRRHGESQTLTDVQTAAARDVTSANLERVASKLQGNVRLRLFGVPGAGTATATPGLQRKALQAARVADQFVEGTSDGGVFVAAIPYLLVRRRAWFERWILSRRDFARALTALMTLRAWHVLRVALRPETASVPTPWGGELTFRAGALVFLVVTVAALVLVGRAAWARDAA